MRLSWKKTKELCIELWTWCAKTGKNKEQWPKWRKKYKGHYVESDCWFCEYDRQRRLRTHKDRCYYCPFVGSIDPVNVACVENSYYGKWCDAKSPAGRKKYAKLFLKQIKKCK